MNNQQLHRGHPKAVVPIERKGTGPGQHHGKVVCRLCNGAFVRWASQREVQQNA